LQVDDTTEIDYFISHSWHDDAVSKYTQLEQVAEDFLAQHGREPTFWLDKCCIDQHSIADGLKVLPVNLMACKQVLVLCGETYVNRLWCMWELYVLFMFNSQNVKNKIVVPEALNRTVNLAQLLGTFDISEARCFDPNEEAKIQAVIQAGGVADFCHVLRVLGRQIADQNRQHAAMQELFSNQNIAIETQLSTVLTQLTDEKKEGDLRQFQAESLMQEVRNEMRNEMRQLRSDLQKLTTRQGPAVCTTCCDLRV